MWVRHHMMLQFIVIDGDANGKGKFYAFKLFKLKNKLYLFSLIYNIYYFILCKTRKTCFVSPNQKKLGRTFKNFI
jgi:hypothetical protein